MIGGAGPAPFEGRTRMLIIRSEQMDVFRRAALRSFEDDMVRKLHQLAPTHAKGSASRPRRAR